MAYGEGRISLENIEPGILLPRLSKTPAQKQIDLYARASGDYNPIHVDTSYARQTPFKGTIAHGMLVLSYISEMMLIAFGSQWLSAGWLSVRFKSPAMSGKKIIVEGKVRSVGRMGEKTRIACNVTCRDESGNPVIIGEAGLTI